MRKFVPLAVLFALLGTLLLSGAAVANTSAASAPTTYGSWDCQKKGKDLDCKKHDGVGLITIIVKNINVNITDVQLINIENALNNNNININTNVEIIEDKVIVIIKDVLNITVTKTQVVVCIVVGLVKHCDKD